MADHLNLNVYRVHAGGQLAVQIARLDENGTGWGHRLAGPKHHNAGTTELLSRDLDAEDAQEIRRMLDAVFPVEPARLWLADFDGGAPTLWTSEPAARKWLDDCTRKGEDGTDSPYRQWDWRPDGDSFQQVWIDPRTDESFGYGPGRITPLVPDAAQPSSD